MLVNADFSRRVVVAPHQYQWVASPQSGVERVMLDRVGAEKARATSIVRYAPDSDFPRHHHPGGEEILVLSGVFSEGWDHYPAGSYLRSPPGSSHQPYSREGAIIFVKLWQMSQDENRQVRIDTNHPRHWTLRDGRSRCPLFDGDAEHVSIERLGAGERLLNAAVDGAEILLLSGSLREDGAEYSRGCWLRLPTGSYPDLIAGGVGATVYLKQGSLGGGLWQGNL